MIPKIIHYCWFGRGVMPENTKRCIESWHRMMPDWQYKLWNEDNFDITAWDYTREAYEAQKYAFVSDVARLYALYTEGGVYMDVDFMALKPFDTLLQYTGFACIEGSKRNPVMMGVIASEPQKSWVKEQLEEYAYLHFAKANGEFDMLPNTSRATLVMERGGYTRTERETDYKELHILPSEYFCPRKTTGEYIKTDNTYAESVSDGSSWCQTSKKAKILKTLFGAKGTAMLIKLKRKIIG